MNFKKRVNGSWTDTPHYIHKTDTDILTTLPAVLYPNDTTATVGLKGNMVQTGTPTPDNPIQPQECGEMTGNLFDKNTITPDKFVTTGGEVSSTNYYCSDYIPVSEGAYYLANISGSSVQQGYVVYDSNKQAIRQGTISGGKSVSGVVNISANEYYIRINMHIETSPDVVMVNSGSTPLPYEPYGYKIPISSAGQTNNIYLGEVPTTRRIRKIRFVNPSSRTTTSNGYTRLTFKISGHVAPVYSKGGGYCNVTSWQGDYNKIGFVTQEHTIFLTQDIPEWDTLEGATEWLNSNEVYVWYVLATPETGIVNEPLRKIGDYADEVSGITIPTIAGANTLSIGTTLQPSEVTVNYKGWHPVQSVHERENGQWD